MESIKVSSILGRNLIARPLVHDLLSYVRNSGSLDAELDFSGTEFMTRSFADEFHNVFLSGRTADVSVRMANMPDDMRALLEAVGNTQRGSKPKQPEIRVFKPKDFDAMDAFFAQMAI